ncbi:MAG: transcriptional regulator [candidate division Zixibacteria bacterium RBG_16_53_22]|nr:MAG: transcriptional regulator [candidate division Zixibacteria bacterium RBG_16_53_22]
MKVPLLDLKRQYRTIKPEIDQAIQKVLDNTMFIMGPEVKELEEKVAQYCGAKHGIGVASGTDALLLSLRALGVGPGDEVVTTTFSFFATAGVISRLGAKPVFVDIEPKTFNIDSRRLNDAITPKTKAIMPVHLYGQMADMDEIMEIAGKRGVPVVEDAAQAIGAEYKGKRAGQFGATGCFSFFPSKNLGAYGDGGFITTSDDNLAGLLRKLRVHGAQPKYFHSIIGYNSRLDTLQAAILIVKLKYLPEWHEARRLKADNYTRLLSGINQVTTPFVHPHNYHIYHQYTILAENRDGLKEHLKSREIGFDTYYPLPLHMQECYKELNYKPGSLPVSEKLARLAISLPVFPELTDQEQEYVAGAIREFYSR